MSSINAPLSPGMTKVAPFMIPATKRKRITIIFNPPSAPVGSMSGVEKPTDRKYRPIMAMIARMISFGATLFLPALA